MKRSLLTLLLCLLLTLLSSLAAAAAYNPGQRTFQLLGETLNCDKHPVHLVVTQKMDMEKLLTPEAYAKLEADQRIRVIRTEYNEQGSVYAEHHTVTDLEGNLLAETNTFVKNGYWYIIDYANKSYDRLPELPGMSMPFAETLVSWFSTRPVGGYDEAMGYDYDMMTKGSDNLYFYYEKDTDNWKGYAVSYLPPFEVVEYSNTVDEEAAFAMPPEDFKQAPNEMMRNYASTLVKRRGK